MDDPKTRHGGAADSRRPWEPMRLSCLGRVDEVLEHGMGKLSPPAADPGEPKKQKPTG